MFKKIADLVAKLGQNIQFVAFFAHFFCAAYLISLFGNRTWPAVIVTIGAAIKEFYFDARYEKDPPQTFTDNLQDFAGWALGAWIGVIT